MSKTILIVDDSSSLRNVVKIALSEAGYDVIEGGDGTEGIKALDGRKVHLIISDVNMPNMDGITMVKEIKKMGTYQFTPIIMLTTEAGDDLKSQGKEAGVKAWVVKPFKPDQILNAVSKLIMP